MSDRDQTLERQAARYRVFKKRPWFGIWLLLLGIGIPGVTAVVLALGAQNVFFSSLAGSFGFSAIVAIAVGISSTLVARLRAAAINRELEQKQQSSPGQKQAK